MRRTVAIRAARWMAAAMFAVTAAHAAAAGASDDARREANRRTVLAFYEKGLNEKDADAALAYVGDRYVQHNPNAADGREGFRKFVAFLRDKYPQSHSEIERSFVDGDYVILHVHAVREPGTRGSAIVDIFRLENGRIVEHWDVNQPVPEQAANGNTMF
ncbi:nuclear transport factor 2 family protein [Burkholderia stagnalis]